MYIGVGLTTVDIVTCCNGGCSSCTVVLVTGSLTCVAGVVGVKICP